MMLAVYLILARYGKPERLKEKKIMGRLLTKTAIYYWKIPDYFKVKTVKTSVSRF